MPTILRTIVQVKERDGKTWKEVTQVTTVSRNGAGFMLPRPVTVGRLLTLVMPLAPELRAYDLDAEVYPVMGIVQYCNASTVNGEHVYHVGVGFVGKQIPKSFKIDPEQSYRINGMTKEGLWEISEAESQFKKRKQPRYWVSIGMLVSLLQRADKSVVKEETFTQNIAAGGVSVACTLSANVGDKVKVAVKELDFYAIAVVRNRKTSKDETPTLHLEFIDAEFPIERIIAARTLMPSTA
ncbi:MAG TPA: hypothetical protein VHQ01_09715 [Pyrinomonadaceae bacterium]|nr:hypothetical protein [Pyrinomonadaceae bacterium]